MKIHYLIPFALLSILAACSSEASETSGPLAGHWAQHTDTGAKGMTLEFDSASDKLMVHTAPREDGTHDHLSGTYSVDAASKMVTVNCELLGDGKGDVWKGKIDGEHLTVTAGETKLTFHKGEDPHGKK